MTSGEKPQPNLDQQELTARFKTARSHHRAGRLREAETLYRQILSVAPTHPQTLHLLGVLAHQAGHHQESLQLIESAIAQKPGVAAFHNNLGNTLKALDQLEAAEEAYKEALRLRPEYAGALCNLAALLNDRGEQDVALQHYQAALALNPDLVEAHVGLGQIRQVQGDLAQAEARFRRALTLAPDDAQAHFALGGLLRQRGALVEAVTAFQNAVRQRPNFAAAHSNLGAALHSLGRVDAALPCFRRALALEPDMAEAHFNLGTSLETQGKLVEARAAYERALSYEPKFSTQLFYYLTHLKACLADWDGYGARLQELVERTEAHLERDDPVPLPMLSLNSLPLPTPFRAEIARQQARLIDKSVAADRTECDFVHRPTPPERLRIGYVSPDFRAHAVGHLVRDLFSQHDRSRFEVYAYSLHAVDDQVNRRVRASCDSYVDLVEFSTAQAAQRIHADGIHILIDLAGHTTFSRPGIFALRPAPVQAHYLGYLDTMGADFLPYIIADAHAISQEIADQFSEATIYLPDSFAVASPMAIAETGIERSDVGLPEDAFVYCCFNRLHRIEPEVMAAWAEILQLVPESVFWLYGGEVAEGRENLRREVEVRGVDSGRLLFAEHLPLDEHLARVRLADLLLDTFVYNGGATSIGALWAGLPVLTRLGETFLSRMGGSICRAAGLPEMVCESSAEYVERAVQLASQPAELAALRRRLAEERDSLPLFDVERFARHLESAYHMLWADYVAGTAPRDIHVPPLER